jgi:hypothetical protein
VDRRQVGRRLGDAGVEAGAHLVGSRLPDGTLADVADVIEHVVEHAVRLRAKGGPIGRVERRVDRVIGILVVS